MDLVKGGHKHCDLPSLSPTTPPPLKSSRRRQGRRREWPPAVALSERVLRGSRGGAVGDGDGAAGGGWGTGVPTAVEEELAAAVIPTIGCRLEMTLFV
jgi:hypothetical protein